MKTIDIKKIPTLLPKREDSMHKNDLGKVLVVAGSDKYPGAGQIAALSAMRSGAGLVTLATSNKARYIVGPSLGEVMSFDYQDAQRLEEEVHKADSLVLGPGLDRSQTSKDIATFTLKSAKSRVVIDADGLYFVAKDRDMLKGKKAVLTPHTGEFSALVGESVEYILNNREDLVVNYAKENDVILLLKGKDTLISDGKDIYKNPNGNYKMATGGMGDCLSGIIGAFLATDMEMMAGVVLGAFIHSLTADMLSRDMYTVLARDVVDMLPFVINTLKEGTYR